MKHIFVSYSHKDMDYAYKLADILQNNGFTVWIDARLDYGSQWPLEIQTQLDACGAFILIMTPRAYASEWVQSELQRAKRKLKPIFPLLLEGDEPWLSVESTQFYDVRGETFPDEKFYATLKRVLTVRESVTRLNLPKQQVRATLETDTPPLKFKAATTASAIVVSVILCIGVIVAGIGLVSYLSSSPNNSPIDLATTSNTDDTQTEIPTDTTTIDPAMTIEELEPLLNQANISVSTGSQADLDRVRSYFSDPTSDYPVLAVTILELIGENKFKTTEYLDMFDKWYAILAGTQNYTPANGELDTDMLEEAIVKAHNDFYGDNVLLLEDLLESR